MLPTLVLLLLFYLALLDCLRAEDAASTGTDGWGMRVYVSKNPRECAPFHVYYDINRADGDPPDHVVLPDAAALSFLMPDSSAAEWMVLRPPMGTGMLTWTCALPAGTQFVILNGNRFKQMFTVGPSESGSSSCWRNATSTGITSSSKYGSLDVSVYRLLLTASYTPISIGDSFNPVEMPSTVGLDVFHVSLGAAGGGRGNNQNHSLSSTETPEKTTTGVTPAATRLPQAPDGPPGSTTSPTSALPSISHTHSSKKPAVNSPSTPTPLPSATQAHSGGGPSKRGFIIGAVLAALALGAILGAFIVIILKRRQKLKSRALASAQGSEVAQISAFVVLSEGADDRVRNGKWAADHDELEMGTGDPRMRTRTAVSEDLPSYRSSVEQ